MSKYFRVKTNKSPTEYKCNEEIIFDIDACDNGIGISLDCVRWELTTDCGKSEKGVAKTPFRITTSCERPGFAHLICRAFNENDEIRADIDVLEAGAGAEIEKISLADEIPEDFDDFWNEIENIVAEHDTVLLKKEAFNVKPPKGMENYTCYDISISTPLGTPVTGYITYPDTDKPLPITLSFLGYSIFNPEPIFVKDSIAIIIGAHGLENGLSKFEQSTLQRVAHGYGFNEKENADPKTAYWYGVMIRDLCAAKFAKSLPEWDGKNLICTGGSQGAFQATTVAAHEKAVSYLSIAIPWFCNLNASNKGYLKSSFIPKYAEGLKYYDTAFQGTRIKCPVRIIAFLGDYVCPPHTITAFYNGIKSEKELVFIQSGTHSYRPPKWQYYVTGNLAEQSRYRYINGDEYEVICKAYDHETYEESVICRNTADGTVHSVAKHLFNDFVLDNGEHKRRFTQIK